MRSRLTRVINLKSSKISLVTQQNSNKNLNHVRDQIFADRLGDDFCLLLDR